MESYSHSFGITCSGLRKDVVISLRREPVEHFVHPKGTVYVAKLSSCLFLITFHNTAVYVASFMRSWLFVVMFHNTAVYVASFMRCWLFIVMFHNKIAIAVAVWKRDVTLHMILSFRGPSQQTVSPPWQTFWMEPSTLPLPTAEGPALQATQRMACYQTSAWGPIRTRCLLSGQ